jgi:phage terminase small subunit
MISAESKRGRSPNSRANLRPRPENLRPGGKKPREILSMQEEDFCAKLILTGSPSKAAALAGYHPSYGSALAKRPAIEKHIKEAKAEIRTKVIDANVASFVLTKQFLDVELAVRLTDAQTHEHRGDADIMKGFEIGYKAIGAIAPNSVSVNAKASAEAIAQNQLTARRLDLPGWRREVIEKLQADKGRDQNGLPISASK